jgi:hypothetical protein
LTRRFERHLQLGWDSWLEARDLTSCGNHFKGGLTYQLGINRLLLYAFLVQRKETKEKKSARGKPGTALDTISAFHTLGVLGREGTPKIESAGAAQAAILHAHSTLAATHLADPSGGRAERITAVLLGCTHPLPRLDFGDDGPVTAAERVAGAAEARLMMARLMADHAHFLHEKKDRWLVDGGVAPNYLRHQYRFQRALLPSCVGLDTATEARRLVLESVRAYEELSSLEPCYQADLNRARAVLAGLPQAPGIR